jgi:hypothetical protein
MKLITITLVLVMAVAAAQAAFARDPAKTDQQKIEELQKQIDALKAQMKAADKPMARPAPREEQVRRPMVERFREMQGQKGGAQMNRMPGKFEKRCAMMRRGSKRFAMRRAMMMKRMRERFGERPGMQMQRGPGGSGMRRGMQAPERPMRPVR